MAPLLIAMLAGAGLGALKGNKNVQKEAANDRYRKMAVSMSPWTGMGDPGALNLGGPLESGLQGAALGGQVGGMLGGEAPGAADASAGAGAQQMGAMQAPNKYSLMPGDLNQEYAGFMQQGPGMQGSPGAFGSYKYNLMAQGY